MFFYKLGMVQLVKENRSIGMELGTRSGRYILVSINMAPTPKELREVIRCNCMKDCTTLKCSYRKKD